jgi:hypothetical protein
MFYFPPFLKNTRICWHKLHLCGLRGEMKPQIQKLVTYWRKSAEKRPLQRIPCFELGKNIHIEFLFELYPKFM